MNEAQSLELFAGLGIPVVKHAVVGDSGLVQGLSFPVVIKALSADLPHKTEVGAVKLNIQNAEELIRAIRDIKSAVAAIKPDLKLDTFLAEEMARGVGEALIGFRVDPQVGPVVVLAPGGILAEVYGDSAIRMAPIDTATAKDMIAEVKGLAPICGYRNLPMGDLDALAEALVNLSKLANEDTPPSEAEINPLIVGAEGQGVKAVDGLVILRS